MKSITLKQEFLNGRGWKEWGFLAIGLLLQVAAIIYGYATGTPDDAISIICALSGVVSVVWCAEAKISFMAFAYIQMFTYTFGVALPNHLYGECWENLFYFITQTIALFTWWKSYRVRQDNGSAETKAKKLTWKGWAITLTGLVVGTVALTYWLSLTNDPLPFLDAISTVPAFIAQVLLMLKYKEQWFYWIIIDVASVAMYIAIGNWVMVAMFIFWTINCIYGWIKWDKAATAK